MNRIKAKRMEKGLLQPQIAAALKAAEPRICVADVSRYENGVSMPTREQLRLLCQMLGAGPGELYGRQDLALGSALKQPGRKPVKDIGERGCYKLTASVPASLAHGLKAKLAACGYASAAHWVTEMLESLDKEFKKRKEYNYDHPL